MSVKIPDVNGLLQASVFNSKITEIEGKITTAEGKILDISGLATKKSVNNLATKTELKNVENIIPDLNAFVKKTDYATEISRIKNDYVTNAALTSQLNDLKSQHIADEVNKIDDKTKKNGIDILGFRSRLKQKEDLRTDLEREARFFRGKDYFLNSWLVFEPKNGSFVKSSGDYISSWKSTDKHNDESDDSTKLTPQDNLLGK